jgi:hypothetical protein
MTGDDDRQNEAWAILDDLGGALAKATNDAKLAADMEARLVTLEAIAEAAGDDEMLRRIAHMRAALTDVHDSDHPPGDPAGGR